MDATETHTKLVPTAVLLSQPNNRINTGPIMKPPPAPTNTPYDVAIIPNNRKTIN